MQTSTIAGNLALGGAAARGGTGGLPGAGISHDPTTGDVVRGHAGVHGANSAKGDGDGAGIFCDQVTLSISQSTIAKNLASMNGGGLGISSNPSTTISNSTIASNLAGGSGGGLFTTLDNQSDPINVVSTIVALNKAVTDADFSGTIAGDHSLIQILGDGTLSGVENLTGVNPMLSTLALHGGKTATMLPLGGSPAIDHGSNPGSLTADQRGSPLPVGQGVDIGAVETA